MACNTPSTALIAPTDSTTTLHHVAGVPSRSNTMRMKP